MELKLRTELPASLEDVPASALLDELGGPTLFDLRQPGRAPLFVSVLLHGNEDSGWNAVRRLRPRLAEASALVFVGNVEAARARRRSLPGRVDFNRVWEGGDTPEAAVAGEVADFAAAARPRLAVDVHNNTGENPPYAVLARTDPPTLALARAFSERAMLATQPRGFQTRRFARFCPAVTVEVGTVRDPASTERAADFLARLLDGAPPERDGATLSLFVTAARVTLDPDAELEPEMQRYNFRPAPAGTALTRSGGLTAWADDGSDASGEFFTLQDGAAVLKRPTVLAMYTGDPESARLDCLCYFLEPIEP